MSQYRHPSGAGKNGTTYERRQMVDSDDRHPRVTVTDLDLDGRLREGSVDRGVDGNRVMRVGRATNITFMRSYRISLGPNSR